MSLKTLERSKERTDEYIEVRDRSLVMNCNVETSAWLAGHPEFSPAARSVVGALLETFESHAGEVCVTVLEDPESGSERLAFEVKTHMEGASARRTLRQFVKEGLPAPAKALRDEMVFSVSLTAAVKD